MSVYSRNVISEICPLKFPINKPLWEFKHTDAQLDVLREGDPYTFASQFQQDPTVPGGNMFKDKWWKPYEVLPPDIQRMAIFGDTAQKTAEHNDFTVFQCWALASAGIFLVDQIRGKWEAPQIESNFVAFWDKHKPSLHRRMGVSSVMIEDKSSGSSLIQSIKQNYHIPIEPIQRNTDKVLRAMGVVKYFAAGYIHLPTGAVWLNDYKDEFRRFSPLMTHKHDDQIDPTMDAVEDMLVFRGPLYTKEALM